MVCTTFVKKIRRLLKSLWEDRKSVNEMRCVFTKLLLGHSRSGAPFRDVFSILVALSFGAALQLSNITAGGSEALMGRKEHKAETK